MRRAPQPERAHGPDAGFTLVEVVVALVIFVLVSTAAVTLLIIGLRTVRENADRVIASSIARGEVEALQAAGAESLTPGTSTRTVTQDGIAYTVTRSATWVSIDQTADPCLATIDPKALRAMRVQVSVAGGSLPGPQSLIALVPRSEELLVAGTASVSARVVDSAGVGVAGVSVIITNNATGDALGQYETDVNGCLIISGVATGIQWKAAISKAGYVALAPPGTSSVTAVTSAGTNTPFENFLYAPAGILVVSSADDSYPIPSGIPSRLTLATTTAGASAAGRSQVPAANGLNDTSYPHSVTGLFPGSYSTVLGACSDNAATGTAQARPNESLPARLTAARVQVVAAPGTAVTMTRNALASPGTCTGGLPTYNLGTTGSDWSLRVAVPSGDWTFSAAGKEPFGNIQLSAGSAPCSVYWGTGTATAAKDRAQQVASRANDSRDDSNPVVTDAMLLSAAQSIQGLDYAAPSAGQLTILKALGSVTASATVRISAAGAATVDDTVSLTRDGQPFTVASPCNANAPLKGSP